MSSSYQTKKKSLNIVSFHHFLIISFHTMHEDEAETKYDHVTLKFEGQDRKSLQSVASKEFDSWRKYHTEF